MVIFTLKDTPACGEEGLCCVLSGPYSLFTKRKERNQLFLFNTVTDPIHKTYKMSVCISLPCLSFLLRVKANEPAGSQSSSDT